MDILDKIDDEIIEPKNLKRAALLFKLCVGLLLFSFISTAFIRPLVKGHNDIMDLLIGLPVIAIIFISPPGLFYSLKSMRKKEGLSRTRFMYFLGHLFFCLLILGFIGSLISDFSQLF